MNFSPEYRMDAVITYIDPRVPAVRERLDAVVEESHGAAEKEGVAKRFACIGTLGEQVRLIRKNARFVDTVFVVVSDREEAKPVEGMEGVRIVTHDEFMPAEMLPVFNALTIEAYIHRIPGLGHGYIYLNDDMYITWETTPDDFVDGPIRTPEGEPLFPKVRCGMSPSSGNNIKPEHYQYDWWRMFFNSSKAAWRVAFPGTHVPANLMFPDHGIHFMYREDGERLERSTKDYTKMQSRLRDYDRNVCQYATVMLGVYLHGYVRPNRGAFAYCDFEHGPTMWADQARRNRSICVNDGRGVTDYDRIRPVLKAFLADLIDDPEFVPAVAYSLDSNSRYWSMARHSMSTLFAVHPNAHVYLLVLGAPPEGQVERTVARFPGKSITVSTGYETAMAEFGFNPREAKRVSRYYAPVNSCRAFLPFLPELNGERAVLSLDSDTEVRGSLRPLFTKTGHDLTGVRDLGIVRGHSTRDAFRDAVTAVRRDPEAASLVAELHERGEEWFDNPWNDGPYVNGGVLVFDLERIRSHLDAYRNRMSIYVWLLGNMQFRFFEQCALNVTADIHRIDDVRFDEMRFTSKDGSVQNPDTRIVHAVGSSAYRRTMERLSSDEDSSPVRKRNRLRIAVYAIAKNEAPVCARWMESVREADAVYVLDTGSSDGTADTLRKLGAHVTVKRYAQFRFDDARNDSMALVPNGSADVLVTCDLDDVLEPGWRKAIEDTLKDGVAGVAGGTMQYVISERSEGRPENVFGIRRISVPGAGKWYYPIHETLCLTGGREVDFPVRAHHLPQHKDRTERLPMMEAAARENPENARFSFYYARELMYNARYDDSTAEFRRYLALKGSTFHAERAYAMRYIADNYGNLGETDLSELWYRRAIAENPGAREAAASLLLKSYLGKREDDGEFGRWNGLMHLADLVRAVKVRDTGEFFTEPWAWDANLQNVMAVSYWYGGRREDAVECIREAERLDPNNKLYKDNARLMGLKEE